MTLSSRRSAVLSVTVALLLSGATGVAQDAQPVASADVAGPITSQDYDELFQRFLDAARNQQEVVTNSGVDYRWMSDLSLDVRTRRVNDIVTVRVLESISGSGAADSALAKSSSGLASIAGLFGLENGLPDSIDLAGLVDLAASTDFEGGGATNRSGTLEAMITTRVAAVLPNSDLILEGVREVEINGDRQMLLLSGIVRQEDIGPNNVVLSPAIGQLRIRYFGEGLIKDTLKPGWITKILNKIF